MTSECAVTSQPTSSDYHVVNGNSDITEKTEILSQNETDRMNRKHAVSEALVSTYCVFTQYADTSASDTACFLCCFEFWRDSNSLINHEGGDHGDCCGNGDGVHVIAQTREVATVIAGIAIQEGVTADTVIWEGATADTVI